MIMKLHYAMWSFIDTIAGVEFSAISLPLKKKNYYYEKHPMS